MLEQFIGVKAMLQPFVIAEPMHALFIVLMVPTIVESQKTSHVLWQLAAELYVPMPTCATQLAAPLHTMS